MNTKVDISLEKPCTANWREFKQTNAGGFCEQCSKEVIDFTQFSDQEVFDYFVKNKTDTCGKFYPQQLKTYKKDYYNGRTSYIAGVIMGILAMLQNTDVKSQDRITPENQIEAFPKVRSKLDLSNTNKHKVVILGNVRDEYEALPGAAVSVVGYGVNTSTNIDGDFELRVECEIDAKLQLKVDYIGYESLFKTLETKDYQVAPILLEMKMNASVLGGIGIVVGGAVAVKKWSPKWIWWKIKGIFT